MTTGCKTWIDQQGKVWKLRDMEDGHLRNVIKYLFNWNQLHPKLPELMREFLRRYRKRKKDEKWHDDWC